MSDESNINVEKQVADWRDRALESWQDADYNAHTDVRIEAIPVGEQQFKNSRDSLIIEVARRQGQLISLAE